eukprot:gene1440-32814_t
MYLTYRPRCVKGQAQGLGQGPAGIVKAAVMFSPVSLVPSQPSSSFAEPFTSTLSTTQEVEKHSDSTKISPPSTSGTDHPAALKQSQCNLHGFGAGQKTIPGGNLHGFGAGKKTSPRGNLHGFRAGQETSSSVSELGPISTPQVAELGPTSKPHGPDPGTRSSPKSIDPGSEARYGSDLRMNGSDLLLWTCCPNDGEPGAEPIDQALASMDLTHGRAPTHSSEPQLRSMDQTHGSMDPTHGRAPTHGSDPWLRSLVQTHGSMDPTHGRAPTHGSDPWLRSLVQTNGSMDPTHGRAPTHSSEPQLRSMDQTHGSMDPTHGRAPTHSSDPWLRSTDLTHGCMDQPSAKIHGFDPGTGTGPTDLEQGSLDRLLEQVGEDSGFTSQSRSTTVGDSNATPRKSRSFCESPFNSRIQSRARSTSASDGLDSMTDCVGVPFDAVSLCFHVVTWNMGSKVPSELPPSLFALYLGHADVYVIGTQESGPFAEWEELIAEYLTPLQFTKVAFESLMSIGLLGGVAVSFSLGGLSILLVTSHLAAHEEFVERRNADFNRIRSGLFTSAPSNPDPGASILIKRRSPMPNKVAPIKSVEGLSTALPPFARDNGNRPYRGGTHLPSPIQPPFSLGGAPTSPPTSTPTFMRSMSRGLKRGSRPRPSVVDSHDVVIWSTSDVLHLLVNGQLEELHASDQLMMQQSKGAAFQGFSEQAICFPPTFKYIPGSEQYNLKRVPSWTDRILHKCNGSGGPSCILKKLSGADPDPEGSPRGSSDFSRSKTRRHASSRAVPVVTWI